MAIVVSLRRRRVLGNIQNIGNFPGLQEEDRIDKSRVTQATKVKKYAAGWAGTTPMSLTVGFSKEDISDLYALYGLERSSWSPFADGSTLTFDGHLSNLQPKGDRVNEVLFDLEIACDDLPVFVEAPAA